MESENYFTLLYLIITALFSQYTSDTGISQAGQKISESEFSEVTMGRRQVCV